MTDSVTSLEWAQKSWGQAYWEESLAACEDLTYGGFSDWRLPNILEINSLINYGLVNFNGYFSDFPGFAGGYVSSSTTDIGFPEKVWTVYVPNKGLGNWVKTEQQTSPLDFICVRSKH